MSSEGAYKVILENNKASLWNVPFVSIMNVSLYYLKIIFYVGEIIAKTDKERQAKRREKLSADKKAYKAYLEKDKLRKAKKWLNEKKNGLTSKRQYISLENAIE